VRRAELRQVAAAQADVLVIGGGIVGAGVARDAAMRGLRTVLVERHDLAWGTSSRSSRLVHGGLRYLEHGALGLVAEALRERAVLRRIAPHLVRPLPFVFPVHAGDRIGRAKLAAGLVLYDVLALFRNVGRHRMLSKRQVLAREPLLRDRGLQGGALYYDAQCDDARLVIATARSAAAHGAAILHYADVRTLRIANGRVAGAEVEDRLTGARATIEARAVVSAAGPWTDEVRRLEDPAAPPLLRLTKGVHVVVPRARLGHQEAITFTSPIDGRVMFVLPWGDLSYIGTTDTDTTESPEAVRAGDADVLYLLRSANALFPGARLGVEDVRATWAGLRPLLRGDSDGGGTAAVPREHAIVEGAAGMVAVAGGKLTTYRAMAAETVDRVVRRLGRRDDGAWPAWAPTDAEPLPGGESADLAQFAAMAADAGLPPATVDHLLRHYGTETAGICNLAIADRSLARPLDEAHPAIEAEVVHAVRRELACRVEDMLVRRIHLHYETPDRGRRAAARTAELMGRELGWDGVCIAAERGRYAAMLDAAGG
jgi:glycerol-3-phosphate dehydrogenase